MTRRGFTLIEIMLVVTLMALLSGAAALKLMETVRSATLEDLERRVSDLDRLARSRASNGGLATQLVFQPESGKVFYREKGQINECGKIALGRCKLLKVETVQQSSTASEIAIDCSAGGYTPSYCVGIADASGATRWVCVAGLTGQVTVTDDEAKAQMFLDPASPNPASHDAR